MNRNIYIKEIIVNNKPLILTNAAEKYISDHVQAAGYLLLSGAFARNIRLAKKHLENISGTGAIIHDISSDALEDILNEEYTEIKAAGGLVVNEEGKLLMIFRRGHWDLPKGKMDHNESEQECAEREVKEETGLQTVKAKSKVRTTYHLYDEKNRQILKRTEWFAMTTSDESTLKPQLEEDILMAKWVDKKEAPLLIRQTYTIVRDLVNEYFLKA